MNKIKLILNQAFLAEARYNDFVNSSTGKAYQSKKDIITSFETDPVDRDKGVGTHFIFQPLFLASSSSIMFSRGQPA